MTRGFHRYVRTSLSLALLAGLLSGGSLLAKEGFSDNVVTLKDGLKTMLQAEGAAKLNKLQVTLDAAQKAEITKRCGIEMSGTYTLYQGLKTDGSVMGTVLVMSEAGKEGPLELLIALKPDGSVYDSAFTVFGEERGKPALSWSFLKQFNGKSATSPLQLGKDIDAVSGATYTSKSISGAIKKATCLYPTATAKGS